MTIIKAYNNIRLYAPYAFWSMVALVTILLLMEHAGTVPIFPYLDKIIHACLFSALSLIGYLAYANYKRLLCIGLATYGAVTELMQGMFTETRFASVYDWLADLAGILIALLLISVVINKLNLKSSDDN